MNSVIICPLCRTPMEKREGCFMCSGERVHCYDIAASGYVNLLPPGKMNNRRAGDGQDMLRCRSEFLAGGYYDCISDATADIIAEYIPVRPGFCLADAGCGEGYHLRRIAKRLAPSGDIFAVGLDASKFGVNIGAKSAKKEGFPVFFAAANIFSMPLADKSCDAMTVMFAPVPAAEAARAVADDGVLVTVAAGREHLCELRALLYDDVRDSYRPMPAPEGFYELARTRVYRKAVLPDSETVQRLFTMTPFYHRCPSDGRERIAAANSLEITIDADITIFKKDLN